MRTDTRSHLSPLCPHHQVKGKKGWVVSPPRARDGEYTEEYGFSRLEDSAEKGRTCSWLRRREERSLFLIEGMVSGPQAELH